MRTTNITCTTLFRYTLATLFEIALVIRFSTVVPSSCFLLSALVGFSAIEVAHFRWKHVAKHAISRRHFNSTAYEVTRHPVHILDYISLPQFHRESELCTWICPRAISIQATNPVQKKSALSKQASGCGINCFSFLFIFWLLHLCWHQFTNLSVKAQVEFDMKNTEKEGTTIQ